MPKTTQQFGYDADGNLTSDGRWTYTWDAENRLVNMTSLTTAPPASKLKLDFAYDAKGRRIQKIVSTWTNSAYVPQSTNKFIYNGWNLLLELNGTNNGIIQSYMWGLDQSWTEAGAGGVGGLLAVSNAATGVHFVAYDCNGNVVALVQASDGKMSANYEYGPFGEVIRATGPMAKANPFRFSTKYQDDESDLVYYGYRYYNHNTGRWISRDPIVESGGRNIYAFVANSPLTSIDRDGRFTIGGIGVGTKCGGWNVIWYFQTDMPPGDYWYVAHIHETWTAENCQATMLNWTDDYFEGLKIRDPTGRGIWKDNDSQESLPGTHGYGRKVTAEAKLFSDSAVLDTLVPQWGHQCKASGNIMWSTSVEPPFWQNSSQFGITELGSVTRKSWMDNWDCCCGSADNGKLQFEPKLYQ